MEALNGNKDNWCYRYTELCTEYDKIICLEKLIDSLMALWACPKDQTIVDGRNWLELKKCVEDEIISPD